MEIAYLNGKWMAPDEATVSVFDRGFMFGDGIYEVMAVYGGKVFTLEEHLDRLLRSLREIRMESPLARDEWRDLINGATEKSGEQDACLYLQVTRGVSAPRSHLYPGNPEPTVLITVTRTPALDGAGAKPCRLVTLEDYRWGRGDIKVTSLVAAGMLKDEALSRGYDDALLIRDGKVTEATAANVFIVKEGVVITPPGSRFLLHGITRDRIIKLARGAAIPVDEREIAEGELPGADEAWLSSTGHEILPVSEINDRPVGNGEPGAMFNAVNELFQASKLA